MRYTRNRQVSIAPLPHRLERVRLLDECRNDSVYDGCCTSVPARFPSSPVFVYIQQVFLGTTLKNKPIPSGYHDRRLNLRSWRTQRIGEFVGVTPEDTFWVYIKHGMEGRAQRHTEKQPCVQMVVSAVVRQTLN